MTMGVPVIVGVSVIMAMVMDRAAGNTWLDALIVFLLVMQL
jgi:hypothetical protein